MKSYKLRTAIYIAWFISAATFIIVNGSPYGLLAPFVFAVPYAIDNITAKVKERKAK